MDGLALFRRPLRAIEMNGDELTMKAVAVACAAVEHAVKIGTGRKPDSDALLCAPELFDAVAREVAFELLVDDVGGEEQSDFT